MPMIRWRVQLHLAYIFAGTAAHQLERLRQLRAVVGDRGGAPESARLALLVEDRIAVVEAVERLRQAERVFGDDRQLQRANRLVDDLVEPRGFEHQPPELVRVVAAASERSAAPTAAPR